MADLLILSMGMHWRQITREAEEAMRGCKAVFFQGGDPTLADYVREMGPEGKELNFERAPSFTEDQEDRQWEPLLPLFEALNSANGPIGILLPGHAAFMDGICRLLVEGCKKRNKSWRIFDGVSSFDSLLRALGLELTGGGIQVADAAAVVKGWPIDPRQPAMLFRPGSPIPPLAKNPKASMKLLAKRLLQDYPKGHTVHLAACYCGDSDEAVACTLEKLDAKAAWTAAHYATLLVPAIKKTTTRQF